MNNKMELLGTLDFLGEAGVGESGATSTTPLIGGCVVGTRICAGQFRNLAGGQRGLTLPFRRDPEAVSVRQGH
jgi:hypothetical protein